MAIVLTINQVQLIKALQAPRVIGRLVGISITSLEVDDLHDAGAVTTGEWGFELTDYGKRLAKQNQ